MLRERIAVLTGYVVRIVAAISCWNLVSPSAVYIIELDVNLLAVRI